MFWACADPAYSNAMSVRRLRFFHSILNGFVLHSIFDEKAKYITKSELVELNIDVVSSKLRHDSYPDRHV